MAEEKGQKKKQVHTWDIIGRLIELLRILQENTDEYTTITQSEIEEKMRKNDHACPGQGNLDRLCESSYE